MGRADDYRGLAGSNHVGAHLPQLTDIEQAIIVDALVHDTHALRLSKKGAEVRLMVGGKAGIRQCLGLDVLELASLAADPDTSIAGLYLDVCFTQLGKKRVEVLGRRPFNYHFAAGDGGGEGEETGFEAVSQDTMAYTVKLRDALDFDNALAHALDLRSHLLEHPRDMHDLGLDGGVDDRCFPFGQHGGEDDVHRARDARVIEEDAS